VRAARCDFIQSFISKSSVCYRTFRGRGTLEILYAFIMLVSLVSYDEVAAKQLLCIFLFGRQWSDARWAWLLSFFSHSPLAQMRTYSTALGTCIASLLTSSTATREYKH
jgi:hypothetical protein